MSASVKTVLTASASAAEVNSPRLSRSEWRRRFLHMSPGVLPFLLWPFPHRDPLSPTLWWIILGLGVTLGCNVFVRYRSIQRDEDRQRNSAVFGYMCSVLLTVLLFPAHLEIALATLVILAFGDGSATMLGKLLRGPRLPWNGDKSWTGLMAFIGIGGLMATTVYWGETWFNPEAESFRRVGWFQAAALVFPVVIACAVMESIRSRWNDNIRVGLTAAAGLACMHAWHFGL